MASFVLTLTRLSPLIHSTTKGMVNDCFHVQTVGVPEALRAAAPVELQVPLAMHHLFMPTYQTPAVLHTNSSSTSKSQPPVRKLNKPI